MQAPGPQGPKGASIADHLRRGLDWDMNQVEVTPREREQLIEANVIGPRLQGLLAWRRSCLLIALPVLVLSVILSGKEAVDTETEGFTSLGELWVWFPTIGLLLIPIGVLVATQKWTELRSTSKVLVSCWVGSIALPLVAALIPIEFLIDTDLAREAAGSEEAFQFQLQSARVALALSYALTLLPIIISVPAGVLRGAVRVKTVFPAAVLPGWFLVAVAPFYSLFMIVVFVLIEQIVGNLLLVLGVGLLAFAPWLFVIHRKVYARSMSNAEAATEMGKAAKTGRYVLIAGVACIAIFIMTAKVGESRVVGMSRDGADDDPVFTLFEIARTGVELFSRSLVTTVVFSLIVLTMVYSEWRNNQTMTFEIRREHEAEMGELRKFAEAPGGIKPV
jgi:hypothetical protein